MNNIENITLITGIFIIGSLTILYIFNKVRKIKIVKFIIHGSKEVKRLHYILKCHKFKITDVNKNYKFRIVIDKQVQRFNFNVIAEARKKYKYLCFIKNMDEPVMNYEMMFQIIKTGRRRGLIVDPELFNLKVLVLK